MRFIENEELIARVLEEIIFYKVRDEKCDEVDIVYATSILERAENDLN